MYRIGTQSRARSPVGLIVLPQNRCWIVEWSLLAENAQTLEVPETDTIQLADGEIGLGSLREAKGDDHRAVEDVVTSPVIDLLYILGKTSI